MKRNNSILFVVQYKSRGTPAKSCLTVSLLLCLLIALFSACRIDPTQQPSESQIDTPQQPAETQAAKDPDPGNAHTQLILINNQLFAARGYITYSLPDGAQYVGEVRNVGTFNIKQHLDGNHDGYVYSDPDNDEIFYFEHAHWDIEENNGRPSPYVILQPAKN